MKAFILAAGSGIRLRPLTDTTPKCLLPIGGVPLLEIWLKSCSTAGITDVIVNAHEHAPQIIEFARRPDLPVRVQVAEERILLGSAGTLEQNRGFVNTEEAFFVVYGDVLTNLSLRDLMAFHATKKMLATLGIYPVADPTQYGIVTTDEESVVRSFEEKPQLPESNWAFSGVMIANPRILDFVPAQRPAEIGFHLLPRLIGKMCARPIADFLLDIGTRESYKAAQTSWPGLKEVF